MEKIKTMCPRCFKGFETDGDLDKIICAFCEYEYDLPKFHPKYKFFGIKETV